MAITTISTIGAFLEWTQQSIVGLTTLTDSGKISISSGDLGSGTGNGQANLLWHDTQTLPSGGVLDVDLFNLSRELFNDSYTISFSGGVVKTIVVANTTPSDHGNMEMSFEEIDPSNTGVFDGPVRGGTGVIDIPSSSAITLSHISSGWPVETGTRIFRMNDYGGSGCVYEIAILGVTGA